MISSDILMQEIPLQKEISDLILKLSSFQSENRKIDIIRFDNPNLVDLENISKRVAILTRFFNPVELITVDDVEKIKKNFLSLVFSEDEFNPEFTYEYSLKSLMHILKINNLSVGDIENELNELQNKLSDFKPLDQFSKLIKKLLRDKIKDELLTIKLIYGLRAKDEVVIKESLLEKYDFLMTDELYRAIKIAVDRRENKKLSYSLGAGKIDPKIVKQFKRRDLRNDPDLLRELEANSPDERKFYFNSEEIQSAFSWVLNKYYEYYEENTKQKFPNELKYAFSIDKKYSDIDVRDKSSAGMVICIPKNRILDVKKLLELIAHEIESHCRQSLNGAILFRVGGGELKVDDETLYEGLAIDAEDSLNRNLFGLPDRIPEPYYAISIMHAMKGKSFLEVFKHMYKKFLKLPELRESQDKEEISAAHAWKFTYRVFRGHISTRNEHAYAFCKDIAYFRGTILHKQLKSYRLDHINQAAIMSVKHLQTYASFGFTQQDLPFPFLNLTEKYYIEVLKERLDLL